MVGIIIHSDACVERGARELVKLDERFAPALEITGPLPLRRKPEGFTALFGAIVSQQISVAAATSIWTRLETAGLTDLAKVRDATEDDLRSCGLSRPKIKYVQGLAASQIDYVGLRSLSDAEVIGALVKLPGIGPWTAQIYAMFSLGRSNAFAPGDLALQEAARILFELEERPTAKELALMAEKWTPWSSVAARALFAYYRLVKDREGMR